MKAQTIQPKYRAGLLLRLFSLKAEQSHTSAQNDCENDRKAAAWTNQESFEALVGYNRTAREINLKKNC